MLIGDYMIKLFLYGINEYLLLEEELNKLGKKGYSSSNISYLSFFKKTDQPVYYKVDLFKAKSKSINKRYEEQMYFMDYYLERDYKLISNFKNMYVFKGNQPIKSKNIDTTNLKSIKAKKLILFILSLLLLFILYQVIVVPLRLYHLTTNGRILFYISLLFFVLSLSYRLYVEYNGIAKLMNKEKQKNIELLHKISTVIPMICLCMIICSQALEMLETQSIDIPSDILTLKDFQINDNTEYSMIKKSSFIIPKTYEYIEYTQEQKEALIIKQYQLSNQNDVTKLVNEYLEKKDSSSIKKEKNYYLCYENNEVYLVIDIQDTTVTVVNTSFALNQDDITKITAH
jgi:hypothetical protein